MKNKIHITRKLQRFTVKRPDKKTRMKLKEMVKHYELKPDSKINNSYKFYTGFASNWEKIKYGKPIDTNRGQGKI